MMEIEARVVERHFFGVELDAGTSPRRSTTLYPRGRTAAEMQFWPPGSPAPAAPSLLPALPEARMEYLPPELAGHERRPP